MKNLLACAGGASVLYIFATFAQHGAVGGEWREYSGDAGASKYSPLEQIDRTNVGRLRIAWRRPALDAAVLAGNDARILVQHSECLLALDAKTGKPIATFGD